MVLMRSTPTRLLTRNEAAEHAGVHRNTISRWIADGSLTKYTVRGRFVRVDVSELDTLIKPVRKGGVA